MRTILVLSFLTCLSCSSVFAQSSGGLFGFLKKKKHKARQEAEAAIEAPPPVVPVPFSEFCEDTDYLKLVEAVAGNSVDLPPAPVDTAKKDICQEENFIYIQNNLGKEVLLNKKWLLASDYFSVWDSRNVDPYGYKLKSFQDTIPLYLYGEAQGWSPPIKNTKINSNYGLRRWRWHHGIDLDLEIGDSIFAAFNGVVRIAKYNRGGYGYYVMLRHENGLETLYGHLDKILVEVGQEVKAGELIGLGGNTGRSTGPHLHYEVRYKGHAFNPLHLYNFEKEELLTADFQLTANHYKGLLDRTKSVYHRIRSGDSLWVISRRYGTSVTRLCRLNGISRNTTLRVGRSLRVR